jgi:DNA-binding CsgD family transcriptional regulator
MRTDRMIGFTLTISPAFAIGVGLQRRRRDFTERERLLLNVLRPHLLQAYRNANAVTLLLEALDRGIVILGRNGRVQLMTVKSRRCLKEYFGARPIERGRLPDALQRWIEHQHRVLAVDDDLPPPRPQLLVKQGEKRLIVRHIPHWSQDLLLFEEQLEAPKPAAFGAFGLTQREAEVLSWVAEGKTNADIGIIIGAGTRTVEKHLERIFQKLGVETRTAASVFALQARKVER